MMTGCSAVLVARLNGVQEAVSSTLATRTTGKSLWGLPAFLFTFVVLSGLFCRVMIYFNYTVTVIGTDIAWLYALKSILSAFQRNSLTAVLPRKQKLNNFICSVC